MSLVVSVPVKTKNGVKRAKAKVKIASGNWVWVRLIDDAKYLYRYSVDDVEWDAKE